MNRRIEYYDSILDNNSYVYLSLALFIIRLYFATSRGVLAFNPQQLTLVHVGWAKVSYRRGMGSAVVT